MGLDLTCVFQCRSSDGWVDVESDFDPGPGRDYVLFAWLGADVVGRLQHDVRAIAPPRGLPPDFLVDSDGRHPILHNAIRAPSDREMFRHIDMHPSHPSYLKVSTDGAYRSWLSAEEILRAVAPQHPSYDPDDGEVRLFIAEVLRLHQVFPEVRVVFCFH